MANRRFEDFEVVREFQHTPGRTVFDAKREAADVPA